MKIVTFYRQELGFTKVELGRKFGINPTNLSRVEQGFAAAWPRLRRQYAEALGVAVEELFDEQGYPLDLKLPEATAL